MPFPDMSDAFLDWQSSVKFSLVTKEVDDFEIKETLEEYNFMGLFYPSTPQQIALKPEGQRTWKWWSLITQKKLNLDDIVKDINTTEYRVMSVYNWSQAGFYQYELTEKYTDGQSA